MKNQNDIIISIVAGVLAIIFGIVFYVTKRDPVAPPAPPSVILTPVQIPAGEVVYSNGLPNASAPGGSPAGFQAGAGFSSPVGGSGAPVAAGTMGGR